MFNLFFSDAMAQTATASAQQPNPLMSFAPLLVIFAIFYFLMIKPQKKKMLEEKAMLSALNKGDAVYTRSGILGTITGLTEKIVTLEVAEGVKFKIIRSEIAGPSQKLFETKEDVVKK